eukprot:355810-Chlamydomonas_euryale.AAC.2
MAGCTCTHGRDEGCRPLARPPRLNCSPLFTQAYSCWVLEPLPVNLTPIHQLPRRDLCAAWASGCAASP